MRTAPVAAGIAAAIMAIVETIQVVAVIIAVTTTTTSIIPTTAASRIRGTDLEPMGSVQARQIAIGAEIEEDDGEDVAGTGPAGGDVEVFHSLVVVVVVVVAVPIPTTTAFQAIQPSTTLAVPLLHGATDASVTAQLGEDADQVRMATARTELVGDVVGPKGVGDDAGGRECVDVGIYQD
jgi:hypothetical protein